MKLITEARCAFYGTIHGQTGDLVTLISIRGNMAIVRAESGEKYPIRYQELTCPLTPDNYKPLLTPTTPQDPIKTKAKKTIKNKPDTSSEPVQKTLF